MKTLKPQPLQPKLKDLKDDFQHLVVRGASDRETMLRLIESFYSHIREEAIEWLNTVRPE